MKDTTRVVHAIKETLGSLATPALVEDLIARALVLANLQEVPEEGSALEAWVQGALRSVLDEEVGNTAAGVVAAELRVVSGRVNKRKPARSALAQTARTELTPKQRALIDQTRERSADATQPLRHALARGTPLVTRRTIVAADDPHVEGMLRRYLGDHSVVAAFASEVSRRAEPDANVARWLLLIDTDSRCVASITVEQLRAVLPQGATIVVWGSNSEKWRQLEASTAPAYRWVPCTKEATTDDLGALCRTLLTS